MLRGSLIVLLVLEVGTPAFAVEPNPADDKGTISIMRPEPGTSAAGHRRVRKPPVGRELTQPKCFGVKQDTRRGSSNPVYPIPLPGPQAPLPLPHQEVVTPTPKMPPPLYVPQTGRALPNLPSIGSGPGGAETMQDKSARCAHQAGVSGPNATGNPSAYIGSCIHQ